jgi:carbonic anhydrase
MLTFKSDQLRGIVKDAHPSDQAVANAIDAFPTFHEFSDVEGAIKSDVEFLKKHPLILKETHVTGWVYECETGKVCVTIRCVYWS